MISSGTTVLAGVPTVASAAAAPIPSARAARSPCPDGKLRVRWPLLGDGTPHEALFLMASGDDRFDIAANIEIAHHLDPLGIHYFDKVVEKVVHDVLVKDVLGAKAVDVQFQRLQLNTALIGN